MTLGRPTTSGILLGLVVGIALVWSSHGRPSWISAQSQGRRDMSLLPDSESEQMSRMGDQFRQETEDFVRQFRDMTIRIRQFPVKVDASRDGRFAISLLESEETIASDLRQIGLGGEDFLVRHYSFTCGHLHYSFDLGRRSKDSTMAHVFYHVEDMDKGLKYTYADDDADGVWDRFADYTLKPRKEYVRDGICWKEQTKDPMH